MGQAVPTTAGRELPATGARAIDALAPALQPTPCGSSVVAEAPLNVEGGPIGIMEDADYVGRVDFSLQANGAQVLAVLPWQQLDLNGMAIVSLNQADDVVEESMVGLNMIRTNDGPGPSA